MERHVTATFDNHANAQRAVDALVNNGFSRDRVSLMMNEETRNRHFGDRHHNVKTGDKSGEGAAAGGVLGAIAGGLIALGSLAVPGGIFVAGPIGAFIGGAATGVVGGGLVGALIGAGIPETHAKDYEQRIGRGEILVGVDARDEARAQLATRILREAKPTTTPHSFTPGATTA